MQKKQWFASMSHPRRAGTSSSGGCNFAGDNLSSCELDSTDGFISQSVTDPSQSPSFFAQKELRSNEEWWPGVIPWADPRSWLAEWSCKVENRRSVIGEMTHGRSLRAGDFRMTSEAAGKETSLVVGGVELRPGQRPQTGIPTTKPSQAKPSHGSPRTPGVLS